MIILSEGGNLNLITPDPGLVFWTFLIFGILWFLLAKYAFKPIGKALKDRETAIQDALDTAKKTREEMAQLKAENLELLNQAKEERNAILKEAKEIKEEIISEAKEKAKVEANKIVEDAKREIENKKMAAIVDVKNEVGAMAVDIAEKILHKELDSKEAHQNLIKNLVNEISMS
ncbi:MAG: F0F1 ATP synthase subunit B [Chitinophagales bacterium]|nr:F0F1 ATP synthase subunit B [Chitinophagales bacterium]